MSKPTLAAVADVSPGNGRVAAEKPGFWKRLVLALEAASESDEERLERRVNRLEAEVARLSGLKRQSP